MKTMKTRHNIIISTLLMPALLLLAASCSREFDPQAGSDPVLLISPSLDGQDFVLKTKALDEDDLKDDKYNENVINRLDVFFFDAAGSLKKDYHLTGNDLSEKTYGGKTGFLLTKDWTKDNLTKGTAYTVCLVANSTTTEVTTEGGLSTLAELEALTREEADIYKRQNSEASSDDITYTPSKAFLMNARVEWAIDSYTAQLVGDTKIDLQRAAVKFVIDVSLDPEFVTRMQADNKEYGAPSWKYQHFNIQSYEVPVGQTTAVSKLVDSPSGGWAYLVADDPVVDEEGVTHYSIVTYAYPQDWSAAAEASDEAPAILLSFQASGAWHYYFIPLTKDVTRTQSNYLYRVQAVISSYGSTEKTSSTDVNLKYDVLPWDEEDDKVASINAELTPYIMAVPNTFVFKGGEASTALTTKIKYFASGKVTLSNLNGFYIDLNGKEVPVSSGNTTYTVSDPSTTATSGTLDINSFVPTNGTYREFQFELTVGSGADAKSTTVKIRHYPLDFITSEDGSYSTYNYQGWVIPGTSSTYASSGVNNNGQFRFYQNTQGNLFNAHTFYNGYVYEVQANGNRGNRVNESTGAYLTNKQMYVLQITSSNDKYTVKRPTITLATGSVYNNNGTKITDVTYKISNDDVLSPAFMLGSQLGAVGTVSSPINAAIHCALYREHSNGKNYDNWRLPTKSEVQFMMDNQSNYTDVMAEVVGGAYYWTLDQSYAHNSSGSGGSVDGAKYVRCVRDLTAEELEEINKFE